MASSRKNRLPGEAYLDWFQRTLMAVGVGQGEKQEDGTWRCGYCVQHYHEDCIIDCGCTVTTKCGGSLKGSIGTAGYSHAE